jgi:hypothetical protein
VSECTFTQIFYPKNTKKKTTDHFFELKFQTKGILRIIPSNEVDLEILYNYAGFLNAKHHPISRLDGEI